MGCVPVPISRWPNLKWGNYLIVVAQTFCQKQQGLRWVKTLPANVLMLFLNVVPGTFFHTLQCNFPIDIIALDNSFKILKIWTAAPNQVKIGPMPQECQFVLEAPGNWCQKNNFKQGTSLF